MVTINERRLLDRIGKLGQIGKDLDGKRTRLAADDAEKLGRDAVVAGMREAGLRVETDYIGKTNYLIVYNSKKVIKTFEGRFFVGSVLIVKGSHSGMEFISEDEVDTVVNEFASRMATLCSGDMQFSAYEIG